MSTVRLMRCQDLKRWHTVNVIRDQTLADHQWGVAIIACHLHQRLIGAEWDQMGSFLMDALIHDADEIEKGDIPSPAKEHMIREHKVSPNAVLIQVADAIEAYQWIFNNSHGSHGDTVVVNCHERLIGRCDRAMPHFGQDLLHHVDEMLAEMNLPGRVF